MKVLVSFALDDEFAAWRRRRGFQRTLSEPYSGYEAQIGGSRVCVALTGVGSPFEERWVGAAFDWHPDVCISSGLAGGLNPAYCCGDILVARRVRELESQRIVQSDESLLAAAVAQGAREADCFCTSSEMVLTAEGKRRMSRVADAVEMESFGVLCRAAERGIPGVAIRAISDSANQDLPFDFSRLLNARGGIEKTRLASALARAPHRLPTLVRLASDARQASQKLAAFLDVFVLGLTLVPVRQGRGTEELAV